MNFDWLDNAIWKPVGKGFSELDRFVDREMPFDSGWGAPAAAIGAYFAAPYIGSALGAGAGAGAGEIAGAGGLAEAGGLTTGGPIFVDPTVAGYGEGLSGLGFDTAAEQAAISNSGGLFSSGAAFETPMAFPEGFTQGGPFVVDPTVAGYGENLSSIPGYGFDTAAEQKAIMESGGAFSSGQVAPSSFTDLLDSLGVNQGGFSGSGDFGLEINPATGLPYEATGSGYAGGAADQYGTSLDDFLKEKGLDGSASKGKFDMAKALASALKNMGGQSKAPAPRQYAMQQLQRQQQAQQQARNDVNQLAMSPIPSQGIVQPSQNQALAQQLRLLPTGNRLA